MAKESGEVAELRAMRRTDPKQYWSKRVQDEELRLLAGQAGEATEPEGKAGDGETEAPAAKSDELAEVESRLKAISNSRKADRKSYTAEIEQEEAELLDRREILEHGAQDLPSELVSAWRAQGGLQHNLAVARRSAGPPVRRGDAGRGRGSGRVRGVAGVHRQPARRCSGGDLFEPRP
jgi:hypothetical protein